MGREGIESFEILQIGRITFETRSTTSTTRAL